MNMFQKTDGVQKESVKRVSMFDIAEIHKEGAGGHGDL